MISGNGGMNVNKTRALCDFLTALTPGQVGKDNLLDIRYKTLDWLGCAVAALDRPCAEGAKKFLLESGGAEQASAAGIAGLTSAQNAAFYNGLISHALEYDDTNKIAITHPGAPVVAAALAAAEAVNADMLTYSMAVAVGYEAMIRLGGAANPDHYAHWHTTGTCGTFAAAAAAARIMGLDGARMETAMGIASTMASGLVYVFGTDAKLVTVGNAARNGFTAARLAALGFSAPDDAFAAPKGYARSAGGKEDLSFMVPQPGDPLMLEDAYYKMHASCGHTHSALDALQALMEENRFSDRDVEAVEVKVYRVARELCAAYQTQQETKAKFSMPFCIAVMLKYGRCTLAEFAPEILRDPAMEEYAGRILVEEEPAYTAAYPGLRTEKVTLRLKDGRVLSKAVDLPVGRPPYDFIEKKFFSLAEMTVTHDCAVTLRDAVLNLEDQAPVRQLGNAIRTLRRK